MHDIELGKSDLLSFLRPDTLLGAVVYLVLFVAAALLLSRGLRAAVHAAMTRRGHIDLTTISFLQQFSTALIWVIVVILYAHLIPVLRSVGTALLAGASIASVVIGLAAQSTLGNLVAGISITIYRPFRLGDVIQVAAPTGTEVGTVELISLGYTTLRTADGRSIILPNSVAASQVTINLRQPSLSQLLTITVRISRNSDFERTRQAAIEAATKALGPKAVRSCVLTAVEATVAVFTLLVDVPAGESREGARASVLAELAEHFGQLFPDLEEADRPSFA